MNLGISSDLPVSGIRSIYPQTHTAGQGATTGSRPMSMRERESAERRETKAYADNRIVAQSSAYAQSLATQRSKDKQTSLEKKKVQYNYKAISGQIMRSKTSTNARLVASKAKREVMRLKRLSKSGQYDEEEMQAAIDHAKAMERVAKKKVAHLSQEEMVERTHKGPAAVLEEIEEKKEEDQDVLDQILNENRPKAADEVSEEAAYTDESEAMQEELAAMQEQMAAEAQAELEAAMEANAEMVQESMEYATEEMMAELSDAMSEELSELMEDMGLEELVAPDPNMSEEDLKKLKLKHRADEMKAMTKADADYLKVIFDKYAKEKAGGSPVSSPAASSSIPGFGGPVAVTSIASGLAAAGMPTMSAPSVSVDVSV